MTIDYFIPAIGQQEMLEKVTSMLVNRQELDATRIIAIDNGSSKKIGGDFLCVDALIRNDENAGMVETLEQAKRISNAEILAYAHSDFFIFEDAWDQKIARAFENDPKLGLIGAVGGSVAAPNGGRANVLCSFRNGHVHGQQTPPGVHPAVLLDGCCLIFRRDAMIGIPDLDFPPHHFHDKQWSLQVIMNGYRVGVIQLDCEHLSGQTSCQPECQKSFERWGGEQAIYNAAELKFLHNWRDMLPISVDSNWNYSTRAGPVNV